MSHTDTVAGQTSNATGDTPAAATPAAATPALPDDVATLQRMVLELLATLQQRDQDNAALRHRLALLLQRLYGPRNERVDPNQKLFDFLPQPENPPPTPPTPTEPAKPKRKCRPHGRRPLPEHLPRVRRHYVLTEAERTCATCGRVRHEIGTQTSEQLDYKPASLFVVENVVHKYACPCCSKGQPWSPGPVVTAQEEAPTPTATVATAAEPALSPTTSTQEPMTPTPQPPPQPAPAPPEREPVSTPTLPPAAAVPAVVIAAPGPAMPIAKGLPRPGLLAHLIVSKFVEHLPLYRLEDSYQRQGVFLPRSTLCDWLLACGRLLQPLYDVLVAQMLLSRVVHTDDTPLKLQDGKTHQLSTARMWCYLGDAAHPVNVFDFTLNRKRDGPQEMLKTYKGYLQADAFGGYDCLYLPDPLTTAARIHEVACNAHARRKFYEARDTDSLRAHRALASYGQLYELERQAKDFNEAQKLQMRQDLSVPILDALHAWIVQERKDVLPKSPIAVALNYASNNWSALIRYTTAGFLAIDNNVAEREMKRIAIGRKNWLFVGSPQGGKTAAILMTFTSTCHRLGIEPWSYLQDVLTRLPTTPTGQLLELAPDRWQAARGVSPASGSGSVTDTTAAPGQPKS